MKPMRVKPALLLVASAVALYACNNDISGPLPKSGQIGRRNLQGDSSITVVVNENMSLILSLKDSLGSLVQTDTLRDTSYDLSRHSQ